MRKLLKLLAPLLIIGLFILVAILLDEFTDFRFGDESSVILGIPNFLFPLAAIYYLKISHPDYRYFMMISACVVVVMLPGILKLIDPLSESYTFMRAKITNGITVRKLIEVTAGIGVIIFYSLRFYYKEKKNILSWIKWICIISLTAFYIFTHFFSPHVLPQFIFGLFLFIIVALWIIHIIDLYRTDRTPKSTNYDKLIDEIQGG